MENMMLDEWDNIRILILGYVFKCPMWILINWNRVMDWEYMASEVAMRHDCFDGFAIDLWAVGIGLFEFLAGKKLFAMLDAMDKNFYTIAIEGDLEGLLRIKGISIQVKLLVI
eukprot:CCRYP_019197-RA/>CCRYP_019197-RA protein AED:0.26 eAED:0.20 QI:0/0/0/1/0/0/2/0/112